MKKYFTVSFKYSENVYCSNLAHAETAEAVNAHYSEYEWVDIREATDSDINEATRKGKPIVEIETPEAPAEDFPNLSEELGKEYDQRRADTAQYIENGYFPTWSEEHHTDPDRGIKQYSTATRWEQYKAGTLSREKAVELATRRAYNEISKSEAAQREKLRAAADAPGLAWCQIAVEWVKNSYWGNNPHATATANNSTTYGKASGCGYDKLSAAVADALNDNPAALKALYIVAEKALAEGKQPRRGGNLSAGCVSWRDVLGYGSGYSILPYFEGGCGVSCIESIFTVCGYSFRYGAPSSRFDSCIIERKEGGEK